jgi:NADPH:quinone reductase-like Zn-dependent oxidoreductase
MAIQDAIKLRGPGDARLVSDAPIPKLKDNSIIVKVAAVALNPTDWMSIDFIADTGATIGCDYAGVVQEVGGAVTNGLRKGDRVAGFTHGGKIDDAVCRCRGRDHG